MRLAAIPVLAFLIVALMFAVSCAPREHYPVPDGIPQAAEQCRAQPELDWCR